MEEFINNLLPELMKYLEFKDINNLLLINKQINLTVNQFIGQNYLWKYLKMLIIFRTSLQKNKTPVFVSILIKIYGLDQAVEIIKNIFYIPFPKKTYLDPEMKNIQNNYWFLDNLLNSEIHVINLFNMINLNLEYSKIYQIFISNPQRVINNTYSFFALISPKYFKLIIEFFDKNPEFKKIIYFNLKTGRMFLRTNNHIINKNGKYLLSGEILSGRIGLVIIENQNCIETPIYNPDSEPYSQKYEIDLLKLGDFGEEKMKFNNKKIYTSYLLKLVKVLNARFGLDLIPMKIVNYLDFWSNFHTISKIPLISCGNKLNILNIPKYEKPILIHFDLEEFKKSNE